MSTPPRVRPDTINRLVNSVYPGLALLAGMQLDVFTPLAGGGPKDAATLAGEMGVRPELLDTVLYALASSGLLTAEDGRFANTPEADRFLVRESKSYIGSNHEVFADLWSAALRTADTVRAGAPQAKHDFAAMSPEALRSFFRGLDAAARASARKLRRDFDFAGARHLLDAGGGSGGIAVDMCRAFPELRATVADLPTVTPITAEFIEEAELGRRIDTLACNVVEEAPVPPSGSCDVAVLRAFVQVLSMEDAARALANVGRALAHRAGASTSWEGCWTTRGSGPPNRSRSTSSSSTSTTTGGRTPSPSTESGSGRRASATSSASGSAKATAS